MTQIEKRIIKIIPAIKFLLAIAMTITALTFVSGFKNDDQKNYQMVIEYYIVQDNDDLWKIASKYIDKNSYGTRDVREFIDGIKQINYKKYPDIKGNLIRKNDKLEIHYFIKKENKQNE